MFGPMKEALRGRKFSSDEEVIGAGAKLVKDATKNCFPNGTKNLVKPWDRCVEVEGNYVEK
jgi:hypothetical protein